MKIKRHPLDLALALLALAVLLSPFSAARAQGTAFTYQGRLNNGTNPVTGIYDLTFALYDASTGGALVGSPITNAAVGVTNGLFTTSLNFGPVFGGNATWLAIGVRTNGAGSFTSLDHLQELTPTPYAISAENVTGVVPLGLLPPVVSLLSDPGNANFYAGESAGNASGAGSFDTGVGPDAMGDIGAGNYDSAFGAYAEEYDTTGSYNTASGAFALSARNVQFFVVGSGNTADGAFALASAETSSNNVALGYAALQFATNDNGVVAVGYQALQHDSYVSGGGFLNFTIGSANTAVGYQSLIANTNGSANTAVGYWSLYDNTSGTQNSAFGLWSLLANTTGDNNTAVGALAMFGNTTGYQNTAAGAGALGGNTSGYDNVAIGYGALQSSSDDNGVVAIGYQALQNDSTTGGFLSIGSANTGIGYEALQADTVGGANTAIGYLALSQNAMGDNNLSLGVFSLFSNTNGDNNTALGTYALDSLVSGSGNIAVGEGAGSGLVSGNNNIYIGASAGASDNNVIRIGSASTETFLPGPVQQGNTGINALNVDPNGQNIGNVNSNAITFGISSGEGICSKRANGTAPKYDLELWTDFNERLKVGQNGYVGIGTDNPTSALDVNGDARLDNNRLLLTSGNDVNNGLAFVGSGLPGISFGQGPFLFGYDGGALGAQDPEIVCLSWDYSGDVWVSNNLSTATLTIRGGADLAEPFNISSTEKNDVPVGAVVVIDDQNPGHLKLSDSSYDPRVAGVISGANGINPGIQMHQQGILEGGKNVALTGRVYVQADTSNGPIRPGDQLTTSSIPGRAMRVSDHARAQGAILGKAMTALASGRGMVLVLVTLQ